MNKPGRASDLTTKRRLAKKRRGAAQVEYAFLLGVFVIPMVPVFIAGGIDVFRGWEERRTSILRPIP